MKFKILLFVIFITSFSSYSQDQVPETGTSESKPFFLKRWYTDTKNNFKTIYHEGSNDLYLMGYAYHDRSTYTPEKLKDLNEGAYGAGYGRSRVNEKGNTEQLYLMSHLDSHKDVQINLGYAWLKKIHFSDNFKIGGGYTAFLVSRSDFAHHFPLPFALPYAAIDVYRVSLNMILIPKLNDGINNGNVLFLFLKFNWDREKS